MHFPGQLRELLFGLPARAVETNPFLLVLAICTTTEGEDDVPRMFALGQSAPVLLRALKTPSHDDTSRACFTSSITACTSLSMASSRSQRTSLPVDVRCATRACSATDLNRSRMRIRSARSWLLSTNLIA